MRIFKIFGSAFFVAILVVAIWQVRASNPDIMSIKLGELEITADIADNPAEQARGLMYKKSMPKEKGMIFIYKNPQKVSFWMKNTYIPLDIIFVGEDKIIKRISQGKPMDETYIPSGEVIKYVIEVNQGIANLVGLEVGQKIDL